MSYKKELSINERIKRLNEVINSLEFSTFSDSLKNKYYNELNSLIGIKGGIKKNDI